MNPAASPSTNVSKPTTQERWCRRGVIVCLIAQFLLACDTARHWTPTHDEYWHLPLGLLIWKTGRFDYDVINPPLLRLWAALPLVLGGAQLDTEVPYSGPGTTGDLFWTTNVEHRMLWFLLGRMMVAVVNGATGWLLAAWGRRWFGELAGFAAALLWCTCPTALANGSIVTHDAAAAFGFVSTLYAVICWCEHPSARRAAVAGLCLGIAQLLKVTCVLLFPLAIITWLLIRPVSAAPETTKSKFKIWLAHWSIVFGLAIAIINAGYLFQQSCQSLQSMSFLSKRFQQLQQFGVFSAIPLPLPRSYVQAFDRVAQDLQNKHPVYLNGAYSTVGFPQYYIMAMTYKLPLGAWLLLLLSILFCFSKRRSASAKRKSTPSRSAANVATASHDNAAIKQGAGISAPGNLSANSYSNDWRKQATLVIPILMLIVPASLGRNQIGIRYVLPILPLFYLFAAQATNWLAFPKWRWQQWLVIVALISLPTSLRYHPHHLAYFNEWAGGPLNGKRLLIDSNLDAGQELHALAAYLRESKIENVGLAYFGTVHPHSLHISYVLPPTKHPQPGDYAISVNFEEGRPFIIRSPTLDGEPPTPTRDQPIPTSEPQVVNFEDFGYFRFFKPRTQIGYAIDIFHLTVEDVTAYEQALIQARRMDPSIRKP